jgi:hypothetical protein
MRDVITIQLVAVRDEQRRKVLQGRRVQDRFNLSVLFPGVVIMDDRNSSGLKAARRRLCRMGMGTEFKLTKLRHCVSRVWTPTSKREAYAYGPALIAELCPGLDVVGVRPGPKV